MASCTWNTKIQCSPTYDCPLKDPSFATQLDVWALTGRTAQGSKLERGGNQTAEYSVLSKCEITRLFDDPFALLDFFMTGHMTKAICLDTHLAFYLRMETQAGIPLARARRKFKGAK